MRPLDNKLAYTMEKQLALANQKGGEHGNMAVSHRPNPTYMGMKMKQAKLKSASSSKQPSKRKSKNGPDHMSDDNDDDGSSSFSSDDSDDEMDEDLKAAKSLAKKGYIKPKPKTKRAPVDNGDDSDHSKDENGLYRAPRLSAVEYYENNAKKEQAKRKQLKKQQQKLRRSEVMQTLQEEYGHAPEQAVMRGHGSAMRTDAASARVMEKLSEKEKFEEKYMIRLGESRKDKKEQNRIRTEDQHGSLSVISDLGNLASGIFGNHGNSGGGGGDGGGGFGGGEPKSKKPRKGKSRR
jgi:hypothetical protein